MIKTSRKTPASVEPDAALVARGFCVLLRMSVFESIASPTPSDNGVYAKQWRFLTLLTNDFPRLLPTRLAQCIQGFPRNQSHRADRRFCRCRLSSEGRFCPGSRRITYAVVVDTGSGRR